VKEALLTIKFTQPLKEKKNETQVTLKASPRVPKTISQEILARLKKTHLQRLPNLAHNLLAPWENHPHTWIYTRVDHSANLKMEGRSKEKEVG